MFEKYTFCRLYHTKGCWCQFGLHVCEFPLQMCQFVMSKCKENTIYSVCHTPSKVGAIPDLFYSNILKPIFHRAFSGRNRLCIGNISNNLFTKRQSVFNMPLNNDQAGSERYLISIRNPYDVYW